METHFGKFHNQIAFRPERQRKLFSVGGLCIFLAFIAFIAWLYVYNIYYWSGYPDFGYSFRSATGIDIIAGVSENGRNSGLEVGDKIIEINGKTIKNIDELRLNMSRNLGDDNSYLLERNGRRFFVSVTNASLGFNASFSRSGFFFLLGICFVFIGVIVFLMKPHHTTSWAFILFMGTIGLWMFFAGKIGVMKPFWLELVDSLSDNFIPAVFLHMAACFPEKRRFIINHPFTLLFPYALSIALFFTILSLSQTITSAPQVLTTISLAYTTISILIFLASTLQVMLVSASALVKSRSRVIMLGTAIATFFPLIDIINASLYDTYLSPSVNFYLPFFIFFPLSIAYAIVKHDLFDIDAIIKRTYGYLLTTGALAAIYGAFVLASNAAFGGFEFAKSPVFPFLFILAVVFLFNPVRNRVQRFIDRVFYQLEYDYQATVNKISETMRSLLNLDQVGKGIMYTALETMFIDHGYVLLLGRDGKAYDCLVEAGISEMRTLGEGTQPSAETSMTCGPEVAELKLPAEEPLIQKLAQTGKVLTVYDIEESPAFEDCREACRKTFDRMQAQLLVPLIYENRLTGLLALGRKKSGKFYRREDINLLSVLANQGAVAIENARMVEDVIEKERMEEELSIARDLQVSMLPAECPQMVGFEIAAYSLAAREVGGDFYDFIEMGGGRLGMVIGDVTGKSVSGALVVSASRSVFRMLSEEELTVAERMMRANHRLKKDLKPGMFVALLYAVLNGEGKTIALCSAGQTQPVFRKAEVGSAELIETKGDTFPLGILNEAEYEETVLEFIPGDVIVFYTDGIVEALNPAGEIFGFDRLAETVKSLTGGSAESLLKEILAQVTTFATGSPQHDDLTLIVIQAH